MSFFYIFKYLKKYLIYIVTFILVLVLIILYFVFNNKKEEIIEDVITKEEVIEKEPEEEKLDTKKYIKVDIKGAVNNPGVYELEEDTRVSDQTTPNMIQRISGIFERNALISKEI